MANTGTEAHAAKVDSQTDQSIDDTSLMIPQQVICHMGCHGIDYSGRRYANEEETFYLDVTTMAVDLAILLPPIFSAVRSSRIATSGSGTFKSFSSLKRALGPAGDGKQWHHIVEQSRVGKFGAEAIHNADNVVAIPTDIHRKISGFYSSKPDFAGGQTVWQWLSGQSFEQQRAFGQQLLRNFGVGQ